MPVRPIPIPLPLAIPLSWGYRLGMLAHRASRRARAQRLPIPVISVGNLSVGGTGKTPMVLHLAAALARAGHRPAIAMRGYRPGGGHGDDSDEAQAYRRALESRALPIPIVAQPDRASGLLALLQRDNPPTVAILDDGFQHHRLDRDLDIVLADASRSPFDDRLLPAGGLREPVSALRRADAVILTHAEAVDPSALKALSEQVAAAHGAPPLAIARHTWTGLDVSEAGADRPEPVAWLAGRRILAVCAIGNPGPFLDAARLAIGAEPASTLILKDHDPYAKGTADRLRRMAAGLDAVLTTDKDWSKLGRAGPWPCPVVRPRLALDFDSGWPELRSRTLGAATPPARSSP